MRDNKSILLALLAAGLVITWGYHLYDKSQYSNHPKEVFVKDNEWFTEYIKVEGKRVIVKINDKTVVDYTEPDNVQRPAGDEGHVISGGTFALQGHDPNSKVYFKDILVRSLDNQ